MNKPKDLAEARAFSALRYRIAPDFHEESFIAGFDSAVAFLSEPGAMRFLANDTITRENAELRKLCGELKIAFDETSAKYQELLLKGFAERKGGINGRTDDSTASGQAPA